MRTVYKKKCAACKRNFETEDSRRTCCGQTCGRKMSSMNSKGPRPHLWKVKPRKCKECGIVFKPEASRTRFCGKGCSLRHTTRHRKNARGWYKSAKGYILVYMPTHPRATSQGYVMQHRLVMETYLKRSLLPEEVVHHKNGQKDDNRPENLEVMLTQQHNRLPKGKRRTTIKCPCCNATLQLSNAVRGVVRIASGSRAQRSRVQS